MSDKPAKLIVRNAEVRDIPGIMAVSERVYGTGMGYARVSCSARSTAFRMASRCRI